MSLVLEIEYLSGVAFAAIGPDNEAPDWPPQPDRVFSALVASWAARGGQTDERLALEWLERQAPPSIHASAAKPRIAPVAFVPPNDPETRRTGDLGVLPIYRKRQPRRFPASRPLDPTVRLVWDGAEADHTVLSALDAVARDTAYVGHSASLTRCRFTNGRQLVHSQDAQPARRAIYRGRIAELEASYRRFCRTGSSAHRPRPGERIRPAEPQTQPLPSSHFSPQWLLLDHIDGEMPDIRAAAILAKLLRDTIMAGYQRAGLSDQIAEAVSGHAPDGSPSAAPHLAVVPLAFAGFAHADGRIIGYGLVPPLASPLLEDASFRRALAEVAKLDPEESRRVMEVAGGGLRLRFAVVREAPRRSLDPAPYLGPARTFATVTPIVLDRHLKETGAARRHEIEALIAAACRNIDLPDPEIVVADKHSAVEGAPSAYPSEKAPSWMRWRVPASLASRMLTHAVIRFARPVQGPVMLGAGRFVGLGLCRSVDGDGNA